MLEQLAGVHRFWIQLPGEVPRRLVHRLRYTQVGLGILESHVIRQVTRVSGVKPDILLQLLWYTVKGSLKSVEYVDTHLELFIFTMLITIQIQGSKCWRYVDITITEMYLLIPTYQGDPQVVLFLFPPGKLLERLFQHTFGTHPEQPLPTRPYRDSFHSCLGGLFGVCSRGVLYLSWNHAKKMVVIHRVQDFERPLFRQNFTKKRVV